jgi:hypothetical protein
LSVYIYRASHKYWRTALQNFLGIYDQIIHISVINQNIITQVFLLTNISDLPNMYTYIAKLLCINCVYSMYSIQFNFIYPPFLEHVI